MNRIKILREEKGLTQQDLANQINGAKSTIAMYEKGDRKPSMDVLIKMSNIFNCTIDYLLGTSDVRNPIDINNVQFANNGGIDTNGLDPDEIDEIQKQVEYMKWKKEQKKEK